MSHGRVMVAIRCRGSRDGFRLRRRWEPFRAVLALNRLRQRLQVRRAAGRWMT